MELRFIELYRAFCATDAYKAYAHPSVDQFDTFICQHYGIVSSDIYNGTEPADLQISNYNARNAIFPIFVGFPTFCEK